ncbi:MAG: phospholipid carrier-dependent glycosyltransferase [Chloroflexaceae bacterium]|nr:phospholipid carrier-dependent glycosyltransferase [Chloroflexaceae bacterium]
MPPETTLPLQPAAARSTPHHRVRSSWPAWSLTLLVGLVALLPRCLGLDDFFTVDESFHWVWRIMHFSDALRHEQWAGTNLTGHPGVTTLWLGSLGRWIAHHIGLEGPEWGRGSVAYLALTRLPLAVVNSLAVAGGYLLLRRLLRPETAFLSGLLWASSPFLIAHSRLLHLDALLTSFMTLSILILMLLLLRPWPGGSPHRADAAASARSWLILAGSGLCAGLAFLTKAPSLVLLPAAGLLLLLLSPPAGLWQRGRWVASRYAAWLLSGGAVVWALWPAMWVAPHDAIASVINEVLANGGQPHESGNFFMGQPVADPGWLFYPVVVLWRSTPMTLIGLVLLPLALRRSREERRVLLVLGGFMLLFGIAMSLLPKKFDRYLLPVWPPLEILAAVGLMTLSGGRAWDWAWTWIGRQTWPPERRAAAVRWLVALLLAITLGWYHPYYLAYFNPLLGGGTVAPHVLLVGWGEGMEQVGAWLRTRPDLARSPVMSWDPRTLEPFVPVRVVELNEIHAAEPASYAVRYSRGFQRTPDAPAEVFVQQTPPLYTVRIHGIDYAQVYQPVRPFTEPVGAMFGTGLRLHGFSHAWMGTPWWSHSRGECRPTSPAGGSASCMCWIPTATGWRRWTPRLTKDSSLPGRPASSLAAPCP